MARKSVSKEILVIRRSFAQLAAAFARMGPTLEEALKNGRNGGRVISSPTRRTMTITPKRRAALKLQGRYMGTMRG